MYHAVYLDNLTEYHLREKLACLYDVLPTHILELYLQGPSRIHILVSDHVSISHFVLLIFFVLYTAAVGLRYFVFVVIICINEVMFCVC